MPIARVQPRGQVTIPREVREARGIGPGADLYFTPTEAGFQAVVLPPRRSFNELADEHLMEGEAPDIDVLREQMAEDIARKVVEEGAHEEEASPAR
jgi:AbrB family looped-hinge helix DNA binding protein